jgi:hypothetical protein
MARIFDSSFEGRDNVTRKRHGLPWLTTELSSLRELYQEGKSLQEMCEILERPATGTIEWKPASRLNTPQDSEIFNAQQTK